MSKIMPLELIEDKVVLITGGTGTIGGALVRHLLQHKPRVIRIFSRDENKQYFMKNDLQDSQPLRFFIGDVRDQERLERAMIDVDLVFHLAALKHVESCEYNPFEAIQTNILGTQNIINVALRHNVERVVFSSTDKAVNPANAMGASKLMAEKLIVAANYYKGRQKTIFSSVRFGNVLGSSGSVVPTIIDRIRCARPIEVTHREMTRYIITLEDSLDLLIAALRLCDGGDILIRKMPIVLIIDLAESLLQMHGLPVNKDTLQIVGSRAGEKMFEELVTLEESTRAFDLGDYYRIRPKIGGQEKAGDPEKPIPVAAYTSDSGTRLNIKEIQELLQSAKIEIQAPFNRARS